MSTTLKKQTVYEKHFINYEQIPGVTAFAEFDPENITKDLVEFYVEEAGMDKDTFDVDAAVKDWRGVIESGHGLAVYNGKAVTLEFVHGTAKHRAPVVRDIKSGTSAFEMNLIERIYSPEALKYPTTITAIHQAYLEQKVA